MKKQILSTILVFTLAISVLFAAQISVSAANTYKGDNITLGAKDKDSDTYTKTFKNVKTISVPGHTFSVKDWDAWKCTKSNYVGGYVSARVIKNSNSTYTLYLWSRTATGKGAIKVNYNNGDVYNHTYTVKTAPSSVNVSSGSVILGVGESYGISENTNSGTYANAANLMWSSSDTSVATVTKGNANKAEIRAVGTGTANITIKTYNGKTSTCKVTVKTAPSSVSVSSGSVTLGVGETYGISESTNSGTYANATNLVWSSSNTKVATVTKGKANKAEIKAVGTGTADVTIKLYNGKTATCKVTVKNAPSSVSINPRNVTLGVGESYSISESTNSGTYANAGNLVWSSSDTSIATVAKGKANKAEIKAIGTGTANVTIKLYNGKTASCKVTVKPAPTSVKLSETSLSLKSGDTAIITESTPNAYANAQGLIWTSSNPEIATVTKGSGNKAEIKAVSSGEATITMTTYNDVSTSCVVKVNWYDAQYEYIEHPAETEEVKVVDKEAYTYEEPIYEYQYKTICNTCGAYLSDMSDADALAHLKNHALNGENNSSTGKNVKVQIGSNTITVPEEYHYETVVVKEAWTEKVLVREAGYY